MRRTIIPGIESAGEQVVRHTQWLNQARHCQHVEARDDDETDVETFFTHFDRLPISVCARIGEFVLGVIGKIFGEIMKYNSNRLSEGFRNE